MAEKLLVLGAGPYQIPAIAAAKAMGCWVVAADGSAEAPGLDLADAAEVVDIRDTARCTAVAEAHRVEAVVSICTEVAVETTAVVAAARGLPGISPAAARAATDKFIMREQLAAAGIPGPRFAAATTLDEARTAAAEVGFPLIIKPVDNAGSRGVCRVDGTELLDPAFAAALAFSRKRKVILEAFMEGVESTIEALSWQGETEILAISDKKHVPFPDCVAISLDYPPHFSTAVLDEIGDVVQRSVAALGISCGPTHTEVMVTTEGVKMVELAARGGGFRVFSDVIPLVSGVDAVVETVKMALGEVPDIKAKAQRGAVLRFFNPACVGTLKRVAGLDVARAIPGVVDVQVEIVPGAVLKPIASDGDRPGYMLVSGRDRAEVQARARMVEDAVDFELE